MDMNSLSASNPFEGIKARSFNPGEPVFLQGQKVTEFFGVVEGRFAKICSAKPPANCELASYINTASFVELIDKPDQVFGEIEAFLNRPQPYSVFALDPSDTIKIPVNEENLRSTLNKSPRYGIFTCISFARRLKNTLARFSAIVKEEDNIQKQIQAGARAYLAVLNEIEQIVGHGRSDVLLTQGKEHPAFELAHSITAATPTKPLTSSIYNAVIRPPTNPDKMMKFPTGTMICKKGTIGDRLFILMDGIVEVLLGPNHSVQIARPGSIIGEIAVLLNLATTKPEMMRTADVVCSTPVSAIVLGLDHVEDYLEKNPEVLTNLLLALTDRTQETLLLEETSKYRLNQKLFGQLRHFLEGHHMIATGLSRRSQNIAYNRPFRFAAQQSRQIYNHFSHAVQVMQAREY